MRALRFFVCLARISPLKPLKWKFTPDDETFILRSEWAIMHVSVSGFDSQVNISCKWQHCSRRPRGIFCNSSLFLHGVEMCSKLPCAFVKLFGLKRCTPLRSISQTFQTTRSLTPTSKRSTVETLAYLGKIFLLWVRTGDVGIAALFFWLESLDRRLSNGLLSLLLSWDPVTRSTGRSGLAGNTWLWSRNAWVTLHLMICWSRMLSSTSNPV